MLSMVEFWVDGFSFNSGEEAEYREGQGGQEADQYGPEWNSGAEYGPEWQSGTEPGPEWDADAQPGPEWTAGGYDDAWY